eukprot:4291082-Alexandrium_andersonii.AAC.1
MLSEFAVGLGLSLEEWNDDRAMAACAARLAAADDAHPVTFVLDRHIKRQEAQENVREAFTSGGFAAGAQVIRRRTGSRAPSAAPAAAAPQRLTLRSRSPPPRERGPGQPEAEPQQQGAA